jgi:ankyrin repeat protein
MNNPDLSMQVESDRLIKERISNSDKQAKNCTAATSYSPLDRVELSLSPKDEGSDAYIVQDVFTGPTHELYTTQSSELKSKLNSQLLRAAEIGDIESIKDSLDTLKYGNLAADINITELCNFTPLHNAVNEGHIQAVKLLIHEEANIEAATSEGRTPLHIACFNGNKEIIECLVNEGADINKQETNGNTAVHILAERGWVEALSFLLSHNPDLSIKNGCGLIAVEVATTVETQRLFPPSRTELSPGYNRTVIDKTVLRNNRADMIKSILFKNQLLGRVSLDKNREEMKVVDKEMGEVENRRMKIIKATRKIKDVVISPQEDEKTIRPHDFLLIKKLGEGSFGKVYLAKHKSSNTLYALKMLDKEKFEGKKIFRYAKAERDVLSYSEHPFIVTLHYAFQTSDKLCLVLDYCPGYSFLITD